MLRVAADEAREARNTLKATQLYLEAEELYHQLSDSEGQGYCNAMLATLAPNLRMGLPYIGDARRIYETSGQEELLLRAINLGRDHGNMLRREYLITRDPVHLRSAIEKLRETAEALKGKDGGGEGSTRAILAACLMLAGQHADAGEQLLVAWNVLQCDDQEEQARRAAYRAMAKLRMAQHTYRAGQAEEAIGHLEGMAACLVQLPGSREARWAECHLLWAACLLELAKRFSHGFEAQAADYRSQAMDQLRAAFTVLPAVDHIERVLIFRDLGIEEIAQELVRL